MAEQGGLRDGKVGDDEKGFKSGVKDSNKIMEELSRGMKSKQIHGFRVVEGEDYKDVIEKPEKGCPNVQLGDHNFEVIMNELSMLKSLVEILSSKVEDGCNKVELVDFKNEMVAMRCEIRELTNFVIMSTGVMDNRFGRPKGMSPNSATVDGAPPPMIFSATINSSPELRGRGYSTPDRMFGDVYDVGDSSSKREGKYNNKRKSLGKSPTSVGKSKITKLLFNTNVDNGSPSTLTSYGTRSVANFRCGPFVLERPLLKADVSLLEYLFSEVLDPTEIVVETSFNELRRVEIGSLRPETWVDGEILATVCEMLMKKPVGGGEGGWFNVYVHPRYSDVATGRSPDWIEFVDAHHLKERYLVNLLRCNKAFFPILDRGGSHWFLMVVDVIRRKIETKQAFHKKNT